MLHDHLIEKHDLQPDKDIFHLMIKFVGFHNRNIAQEQIIAQWHLTMDWLNHPLHFKSFSSMFKFFLVFTIETSPKKKTLPSVFLQCTFLLYNVVFLLLYDSVFNFIMCIVLISVGMIWSCTQFVVHWAFYLLLSEFR